MKLGMAFEEDTGFHSSIQSFGGSNCSAAEFIPRRDLSAVGIPSNSINVFHNKPGFGSAVAVMAGLENKTSSDQDDCSGPTVPTIPGKQSGAQLTIFYGGKVNAYDDIAAHKAQAIMLRASGGNQSNSSHNELKIPLPAMKLPEGSEVHNQKSASRKVHSGTSDCLLPSHMAMEGGMALE